MTRQRSARKKQAGATLIEAALSLPVFLSIMFGASNLALVSYRATGLYYTLNATSRWAVLGETLPGQSRVNSIKLKAQEFGKVYGLTLPISNIFVCAVGATSCSPENAGLPETYFQINATEPAPLFFGIYRVNLSYSVLGRNEPYS